ncbi:MAG: DUF1501 domain-containing protein [Phycisphaerales bacterium]|jgi:hypothetical protein|nr:DUF1501 domain-containing protein [Phycisphaerales bacterium]MBT7170176.1 DUF1501 domain-containing protein [Phycisphaerales bacterium]
MSESNQFSRRSVLQAGLAAGALASTAPSLWAAAPKAKPHAKAVIEIWLAGGPAHLDTFDPKPKAGRDYCGPMNKALKTNVKGMEISPFLPQLAKQADKYSLIRSMTHGVQGHETAAYMMQTGRPQGGMTVFPSIGSVVSKFKGYDNGYTDVIPPFISLTKAKGRFSESGFLGPKYKSFSTGGDPNRTPFYVNGIIAAGISDQRQKDRRALKDQLNTLGSANPDDFKEHEQATRKAYELILGKERKLFDLNTEDKAVRDMYGRNTFGQSCLMARRLVQRGVPYICVNLSGWDTHKRHFETFRPRVAVLDQGLAALLQDLTKHDMLDSTLVWCSGEFGRGPKIQWSAPWNGGRSHYGHCFSAMVAGGGFKPGKIVGSSTPTGEKVATRPVYPQDLLGSIYDRLGIDPDGALPNPRGADYKVMPTVIGKSKGAGRLKEIMI